ncbi:MULTISPECIES: NAD-dependent epimerase/dehydratase family protein [unclassified Methylobacterium]|uniref:NAD-dependent epimerase/dehydratase family protein n=1 Tax=unclassified Methylobacterium TaxID=2615210 RepID=UPI0011C1D2A1|nr:MULTISPECIES: NAD-dependent epimerase/dehydratase family protein [unclassified Methylobacterium]QEE39067.1 NAD-dependent epimerase/dehydratase family protein [Methylobacterium sp. WL1]TXN56726.1 NAD-dependent epimerase/dehydratase family protein [Methylobacterium sp. WL2]
MSGGQGFDGAPIDPTGASASALAGARCLVLGGAGFLGLNLCNRLAQAGAEVTCFSRSHPQAEVLDRRVARVTGQFSDRLAIANAVERQDIVFHLIAGSIPESSNRDPSAELAAAPIATLHLLEICRSARIKKVVFASSGGAIYGIPHAIPIPEHAPTDPISAYGISKLMIEKSLHLYRHLHGIDYQILRIANPYGRFQLGNRHQGLIGSYIHRVLADLPLEVWGTGEVVRDFLHIDDVSDAFLAAIPYDGPHKVMNVGSGAGLSVNQIIAELERAFGRERLPCVYKPSRAADVPANVLDTTLIRSELGWRPRVALRDGLTGTIDWMRAHLAEARGDGALSNPAR